MFENFAVRQKIFCRMITSQTSSSVTQYSFFNIEKPKDRVNIFAGRQNIFAGWLRVKRWVPSEHSITWLNVWEFCRPAKNILPDDHESNIEFRNSIFIFNIEKLKDRVNIFAGRQNIFAGWLRVKRWVPSEHQNFKIAPLLGARRRYAKIIWTFLREDPAKYFCRTAKLG